VEPKIDPEFKALLPALEPDEYNKLSASIVKDGCRDAVLTWQGLIIDGMNRAEICWAESVPFETKEATFETREDVMRWMLDNQNGRRNLSASQRAMLAARRANLVVGKPAGTKQIPTVNRTILSSPSPSIENSAKKQAVSATSVKTAKRVIADGVPSLSKAVTDGKVSVSAAASVATLPAKEQTAVVNKGPAAVIAKAKELREEEPPTDLDKWPETIRPVFAEAGIFSDMLNHLSQLVKLYNQASGGNTQKDGGKPMLCGTALAHKYQDGYTMIKQLRHFISSRAPENVCVYCRGEMPEMKTCEACHGGGFSTLYQWRNATENMRANKNWRKTAAQLEGVD
jgi:hypothetical protein